MKLLLEAKANVEAAAKNGRKPSLGERTLYKSEIKKNVGSGISMMIAFKV